MLVLLSGIGPVIPGAADARQRAFATSRCRCSPRWRCWSASFTLVPISSSPATVALFCCAVFVFAAVGQEFLARLGVRRATSSDTPPGALLSMVRRNRPRYGRLHRHVGVSVLFIGVAASATFQRATYGQLSPGRATVVRGYTMKVVRPTAAIVHRPPIISSLLNHVIPGSKVQDHSYTFSFGTRNDLKACRVRFRVSFRQASSTLFGTVANQN